MVNDMTTNSSQSQDSGPLESPTTPPPSQTIDTEITQFAIKWATHFAEHGTGYFEHNEGDMEFVHAIQALLTADRATLKQSIQALMPEKRPDHKLSDNNFNTAIDQFNTILDSVLGGE